MLRLALALVVALLVATTAASAAMRATFYDDGLSCPGDCDAHVVFNDSINGTISAFLPPLEHRAKAAQYRCKSGETCMICFDGSDESCIEVLYRGGGPAKGAFDFTPAWYKAHCTDVTLPSALLSACHAYSTEIKTISKGKNCLADTADDPMCRTIVEGSKRAKDADQKEYQQCKQEGEATYNARQSDPSKKRSLDCAYSYLPTGSNGHVKWRKLLPAACREGAYVGPNGTDCCTADPAQAAVDINECRKFYPFPIKTIFKSFDCASAAIRAAQD
jgi:hypothetical protein